jgi:hypothetical protein
MEGKDQDGKQVMPSFEEYLEVDSENVIGMWNSWRYYYLTPPLGWLDQQFKDAEGGFDGGDGQVGVVGDGSNAMEEFDQRGIVDNTGAHSFSHINVQSELILIFEIFCRQSVAVARCPVHPRPIVLISVGDSGVQVCTHGPALRDFSPWIFQNFFSNELRLSRADDLNVTQELKEQGMVQYDVLTGEDLRKVQRQQYENWFKQQKVWQQERAMRDQMEALDGKRRQGAAGGQATTDYQSLLNSGLKSDSLTNEELEVPRCPHRMLRSASRAVTAGRAERHLRDGGQGLRQHGDPAQEGLGPGLPPSSRRAARARTHRAARALPWRAPMRCPMRATAWRGGVVCGRNGPGGRKGGMAAAARLEALLARTICKLMRLEARRLGGPALRGWRRVLGWGY